MGIKDGTLQKIGLSLAGILAGLILAEIFSWFFLPPSKIHRLPVLQMEADPYCGYRYRPHQTGYAPSAKARINRWGFRGPDWTLEKPPGVLRIVLLGDSYIFGQGVEDDQTLAPRLQDLLNSKIKEKRTEVLNFGVSGYDSGHEMKVLEHYALNFHPDVVVLNFFLNDLFYEKDFRFYSHLFSNEKFSREKWEFQNFFRRSRLLMWLWDLWKARDKNAMTEAVEAYVRRGQIPPEGPGKEGWDFTLEKLQQFRRLAGQHRFQPVVVILPTPEELERNSPAPYADYLKAKSLERGIPCFILHSSLGKCAGSLKGFSEWLIPYEGHFSPKGNQRFADAMALWLKPDLERLFKGEQK